MSKRLVEILRCIGTYTEEDIFMDKKVLWIVIAICLAGFIGVGCKQMTPEPDLSDVDEAEARPEEAPESATVEHKNQITIAMRSPKTLNPILNTDRTVDQTLKIIFDSLVDFDQNDQVIPSLAKSWQISAEGTVVDIILDSSAKWHDGEPLKPEDVVFSIKAIQDAEKSPYKASVKNIISYTATEDNSVRIVYKDAFSGYAHTLYFPIIPAHVADLATNPIGTGAYVFEGSGSSKEMSLTSNPSYFKGSPNIEQIEVLFTPDPESDLYSFNQGIIDVVNTDVIDWEKYAKSKKSIIHEYITLNYDFIGMNFNHPVLRDIKNRQALLYGANRQYLLEKFYLYHGEIVDVPVSPSSWLYEPESKKYDSNPDWAKKLLAGNELDIRLLVNKDNDQRVNVARALKKMYQDIGINLEIVEVDEESFTQRVQNRQYELFLGGWDLSVIPDLSFALHSANAGTGANYSNYVDELMDNLLAEAYNAKSDEGLKEAYSKMQLYISEQLPYLSLHFRTAALITNEKIRGGIKPHHMDIYQNIHQWRIN